MVVLKIAVDKRLEAEFHKGINFQHPGGKVFLEYQHSRLDRFKQNKFSFGKTVRVQSLFSTSNSSNQALTMLRNCRVKINSSLIWWCFFPKFSSGKQKHKRWILWAFLCFSTVLVEHHLNKNSCWWDGRGGWKNILEYDGVSYQSFPREKKHKRWIPLAFLCFSIVLVEHHQKQKQLLIKWRDAIPQWNLHVNNLNKKN